MDAGVLADAALAPALGTGLLDVLTRAVAGRAGPAGGKGPEHGVLLGADLARAVAGGAPHGAGALLGAGAAAGFAALLPGDQQLLGDAESRLLEGQQQVVPQVVPRHGRVPAGGSAAEAATETAAKEAVEDIVEPAEAGAREGVGAAHGGVEGRMAELIVLRSLIRIGKDAVGLVQLLELGLCRLIVGMQIRMAGLGRLPKSAFDLAVGSRFADAQNLVIIPFVCHDPHLVSSAERGGCPPLRRLLIFDYLTTS